MAVYIEIADTGERIAVERPLWITKNRNGILSTPHRHKALGVGDGEQIWSLGKLEGYPEARIITWAEYEESLTPPDPDPELTDEELLDVLLGGGV